MSKEFPGKLPAVREYLTHHADKSNKSCREWIATTYGVEVSSRRMGAIMNQLRISKKSADLFHQTVEKPPEPTVEPMVQEEPVTVVVEQPEHISFDEILAVKAVIDRMGSDKVVKLVNLIVEIRDLVR